MEWYFLLLSEFGFYPNRIQQILAHTHAHISPVIKIKGPFTSNLFFVAHSCCFLLDLAGLFFVQFWVLLPAKDIPGSKLLADWLVGWLLDWLVGWLVAHSLTLLQVIDDSHQPPPSPTISHHRHHRKKDLTTMKGGLRMWFFSMGGRGREDVFR